MIHTESKFSGGKPARGAQVVVTENETGKQLLSGKTDSRGLFSFHLPQTSASQLNIVIDSGDGHRNIWQYQLSAKSESTTPETSNQPQHQASLDPDHIERGLTEQDLTQIFDQVLEEKLAPIRRSLAENREKGPSLQDILGGIGYILGLAGIAAYMKSLKK